MLSGFASNSKTYRSDTAWLRAIIYFSVCIIIGWITGALKLVTRSPLATSEQLSDPLWIGFMLICIATELIAYCVIWRKGTLAYDRPLNLGAVIIFGTIWGICEGLLFLSIWVFIANLIPSVAIGSGAEAGPTQWASKTSRVPQLSTQSVVSPDWLVRSSWDRV